MRTLVVITLLLLSAVAAKAQEEEPYILTARTGGLHFPGQYPLPKKELLAMKGEECLVLHDRAKVLLLPKTRYNLVLPHQEDERLELRWEWPECESLEPYRIAGECLIVVFSLPEEAVEQELIILRDGKPSHRITLKPLSEDYEEKRKKRK